MFKQEGGITLFGNFQNSNGQSVLTVKLVLLAAVNRAR